ncbi:hypothetical protein GIB67_029660 [Kingdonia uniflora]|uniref:Uncharacterized protein n=1 Tax=Kingdonia uniflora TaxID=39325 RepID=A0A7J7LLE0_9MAGN|nr:hypothetical protein GIB67_029660 [Kingdonia uniflora]
MFATLPEEEKGALHATNFAPLLLIGPIATMPTLVIQIFDRHLGDMKMRRFLKKKNRYRLKEIVDALKQAKLERHQGPKKEALPDKQFDHVPLIQLKALIPKIPKKGLANRVPRKRWVQFPELQNIQSTTKNLLKQVAHREILEVANALMVDDDVKVGREASTDQIIAVSVEEQTLEVVKTEDEASQVIDEYIKTPI